MYQFIESIAIVNGEIPLLRGHQARVDRTFAAHYPGKKTHTLVDLLEVSHTSSLQKCRVLYNEKNVKIELNQYELPRIQSLRIIERNQIDYSYKFYDRSELTETYKMKGDCDDILIVKNGKITDSYFANVAFYDGKKWFTPTQPLLKGVRREHLINENRIIPEQIYKNDVSNFQYISLINAMLDLDDLRIDISDIKY
ncbi:MAG: aminotransferase class IV [Reichenbachiella sp.]